MPQKTEYSQNQKRSVEAYQSDEYEDKKSESSKPNHTIMFSNEVGRSDPLGLDLLKDADSLLTLQSCATHNNHVINKMSASRKRSLSDNSNAYTHFGPSLSCFSSGDKPADTSEAKASTETQDKNNTKKKWNISKIICTIWNIEETCTNENWERKKEEFASIIRKERQKIQKIMDEEKEDTLTSMEDSTSEKTIQQKISKEVSEKRDRLEYEVQRIKDRKEKELTAEELYFLCLPLAEGGGTIEKIQSRIAGTHPEIAGTAYSWWKMHCTLFIIRMDVGQEKLIQRLLPAAFRSTIQEIGLDYQKTTFCKVGQFYTPMGEAVTIHLRPADWEQRKITTLQKHLGIQLAQFVKQDGYKFLPHITLFYHKPTGPKLPHFKENDLKIWNEMVNSHQGLPIVLTNRIELRKFRSGDLLAVYGVQTNLLEGDRLRVRIGLGYKATQLTTHQTCWELNRLYTIREGSILKTVLTKQTGVEKTFYTIMEILVILRDFIRKNHLADRGNPTMIICNEELEKSFGIKAFHLSEIKRLIENNLKEVPERYYRHSQIIGWKQGCHGYQTDQTMSEARKREMTHHPIYTAMGKAGGSKTYFGSKGKFRVKEGFLQAIDADEKTLEKEEFTYAEITKLFSKYMLENRYQLIDTRHIYVAIIKGTRLGNHLKMDSFHRCQVHEILAQQLTEIQVSPKQPTSIIGQGIHKNVNHTVLTVIGHQVQAINFEQKRMDQPNQHTKQPKVLREKTNERGLEQITTKGRINFGLLCTEYLYRKERNSDEMNDKIIKEIRKRYDHLGCNTNLGISNISYLLPLNEILTKGYDKIIRILTLVVQGARKMKVRAKLGDLRIITLKNSLLCSLIEEGFTPSWQKLQEENFEAESALEHRELVENKAINGLPKISEIKHSKEDLCYITQKPEFLEPELKFRDHIHGRLVVREIKLLINLVQEMVKAKETQEPIGPKMRGFVRIWANLISLMTTKGRDISDLSEYTMYDLSTVSTALVTEGLKDEFDKGLEEYYQDLATEKEMIGWSRKMTKDEERDRIWEINRILEAGYQLENIAVSDAHWMHNFVPSKRNKSPHPAQCFNTKLSYDAAYQGLGLILAIKVSSEAKEFCSDKQKATHIEELNGFNFSKSRFSHYGNTNTESDMILALEKQNFSAHIMVIEGFSPLAWTISIYHHKTTKPQNALVKRPSNTRHNGRDTAIMQAERSKDILGITGIQAIIGRSCTLCALRNKRFMEQAEGRIHEPQIPKETNEALNADGQLYKYFAAFKSIFIDIAGPISINHWTKNMNTRNSTKMKTYIIVGVCAVTRAVVLSLIPSTKATDIALGLLCIATRTGTPLLWLADKQSGFVKLAKQGKWIVKNTNQLKVENLEFSFCPVGEDGHKNHAIVERRIRMVREAFGEMNMSKIDLGVCEVYNLLLIIENGINQIPIGARKAGARNQGKFNSIYHRLVNPAMLLGLANAERYPTTYISIEDDLNSYFNSIRKYREVTDKFFTNLFTLMTRDASSKYKITKPPPVNSIVAFKANSGEMTKVTNPYRLAIVDKWEKPGADGQVRQVEIKFFCMPQDKVNGEILETVRETRTSKRLDQLILICDPEDNSLEAEFATCTKGTANILNKILGSTNNKDNEIQTTAQEPTKEIIATRVNGTIKWFNARSGFGFITRNDTKEDVVFYKPKKRTIDVGRGKTVEFDVVAGERGNRACNMTERKDHLVKENESEQDCQQNQPYHEKEDKTLRQQEKRREESRIQRLQQQGMPHLHEEAVQQQPQQLLQAPQHQQKHYHQDSKEENPEGSKVISNELLSDIPALYEEIFEINQEGKEDPKDITDKEQREDNKQSDDVYTQNKDTKNSCRIPKTKVTIGEAASDINDIKQNKQGNRKVKGVTELESKKDKLRVKHENNSGDQIYDKPQVKTKEIKTKEAEDQPQEERIGNIGENSIRKRKKRSRSLGHLSKPNLLSLAIWSILALVTKIEALDDILYAEAGKPLEIECEGNKLGSNMRWKRFKKQELPMAEQMTEGRVRKLFIRNATCQDGGFYIAQEEDTGVKCQIYVFMRSKINIKLDYDYATTVRVTKEGRRENSSRLEVTCRINSCSNVKSALIRNGKDVKRLNIYQKKRASLDSDHLFYRLTIHDPTEEDFTNYVCFANNSMSEMIKNINVKRYQNRDNVRMSDHEALSTTSRYQDMRLDQNNANIKAGGLSKRGLLENTIQDMIKNKVKSKIGSIKNNIINMTKNRWNTVESVINNQGTHERIDKQQENKPTTFFRFVKVEDLNGNKYNLEIGCKTEEDEVDMLLFKGKTLIEEETGIEVEKTSKSYEVRILKPVEKDLGTYHCVEVNRFHRRNTSLEVRVLRYKIEISEVGGLSSKVILRIEGRSQLPLIRFEILIKREEDKKWYSYSTAAEFIRTDRKEIVYKGGIEVGNTKTSETYLLKVKGISDEQETLYSEEKRFRRKFMNHYNSARCVHKPLNSFLVIIATSWIWEVKDKNIISGCIYLLAVSSLIRSQENYTSRRYEELELDFHNQEEVKGQMIRDMNIGRSRAEFETMTQQLNQVKHARVDKRENMLVVQERENLTIQCDRNEEMVRGLDYTWVKAGNTSWQMQTNVLNLREIKISDAGLYECIGIKLGIVIFKKQFIIKVVEKPIKLKSIFYGKQDFGFLSAYHCLDTSTKSKIINLSSVEKCERSTYKTYTKARDIKVRMLLKKFGVDTTVLRCRLKMVVKHSYCGQGLFRLKEFSKAHAFVTTETAQYELRVTQCKEAFKQGKLKINLGEAKLELESGIGKQTSETYLHGTWINSKHQCQGSTVGQPIYVNKQNPRCTDVQCAGKIVHVRFELELEQEKAVLNLESNRIEIPRIGLSERIISDNFTKQTQQGLLSAELTDVFPEMECERYGMFEVQTGKLFSVSRSLKKERKNIPDILTLNIDTAEALGNKTVAFHLQNTITACGRYCYTTQIEGILICEAKELQSVQKQNKLSARNKETLRHIGSFGLSHLQINIADSIGSILYDICLQRRELIYQALTHFEKSGNSLLLREGRKFKMFKRGETGYILECKKKVVFPRQTESQLCCANLPISYVQNEKKIYGFITPIEHMIVDSCDVRNCVDGLPLTFYSDQGIPICQGSKGLKRCKAGDILDPNKNIMSSQFVPLNKRESMLSKSEKLTDDHLNLIKTEEFTSVNFANTLINTIEQNVVRCENQRHCGITNLNYGVQRELARQNSSFTDFQFAYTIFGRFCQGCLWVIAGWILLNCTVNFVIKIRSSCAGYRSNAISVIGIFWIFFSSLDSSFNPWSTVRMTHLRKIEELEQTVATIDAKAQTRLTKIETKLTRIQNAVQDTFENIEKLTTNMDKLAILVEKDLPQPREA